MRWVLIVVGILLALMGSIWMLQGLNVLGGSVMSGHSFWGWAGLAGVILGLGLLFLGIRKGPGKAKV